MNSLSDQFDEKIKDIFFESIKKLDTNTFAKCLFNLKTKALELTDDQKMTGKKNIINNL